MRTPLFFILVFSSIAFLKCGTKEATVPAYLHIKPFTFSATNAQGGKTIEITNGQVYVGSKFVGDYEFPITFPVTVFGSNEVTIYPSIKESGVSNGREINKLYEPFKQTITLKQGAVDTLNPTSKYKANVVFAWVEDFDDNAISLQKGYSNTIVDSLQTYPFTHPNAFKASGQGFSAGVVFPVNSVGFTWEAITTQKFKLPNKGSDVYVELDLSSDVPVSIGIVYVLNSQINIIPVATFFATGSEYKKLYINLEPETSPLPTNLDIQLFFGAGNYTDSTSSPKVFLDNLKLAHLQ